MQDPELRQPGQKAAPRGVTRSRVRELMQPGVSSYRIARALDIDESTARFHMRRIREAP
jgi:DNA-binding NarL/FixJ family response regulator